MSKGFVFFTEILVLSLAVFLFIFLVQPGYDNSVKAYNYFQASDVLFLMDLKSVALSKDSDVMRNFLNQFGFSYEFNASYYDESFNNFLNISLGDEPESYVQTKRLVYDKSNEEYIILTLKRGVLS